MRAMLGRGLRPRGGTVVATATAFALTAVLLVWLAVNSLLGPYAGTPRRQVLAVASITLATIGLGVSVAVVVTALRRRRRLEEHMRPGELIVGFFPAELLDLGPDGEAARPRTVRLTLTNQRLLVHEPEQDPNPKISLEHEQIADAIDRGPTPSGGLHRCVLYELVLQDGNVLRVRMDAGTGLDFMRPRQQYLEERRREVRALITEAHGPTPSRPSQALDTMLVGGQPTVCLLELDEHYLRVVGEHSPPLADLYYYFHWEHMNVGQLEPAAVARLPEDWWSLRLQFHDTSAIVVCGSEETMRRVRDRAVSAGAAPLGTVRSPVGEA